ncbi:hypothetical protein CSB37_01430 [bacterium DOLZORAL124_38_8]|nr:MAG: hypothetical protein CSB37_01430 [bacterium DOLZORAL124_38_8]
MNNKDEKTFLSESQKMGKASGKIKLEDFEQALDSISTILVPEAAEAYKNMEEAEFPKTKIALYCHNCEEIVPAGEGHDRRSTPRLVCGNCKSRKVSRGKIESLKKFYHLEESSNT